MRRIYLIGYMGSGKSTVAKALAKALSWKFLDTDQLVIDHCGLQIKEIFQKYGEHLFRGMEANILRSTMHYENIVVATGGGLPCHNQNIAWMNEEGLTIYLRLNPSDILSRLMHERNQRPLLADKNKEDLLSYITEHMTDRMPCYEQAELIIDGRLSIDDIVEKIQSATKRYENLDPVRLS